MNLAKQHEEIEPMESNGFQVSNDTQPTNIITLPEQTFPERSSNQYGMTDGFANQQFSALNEW